MRSSNEIGSDGLYNYVSALKVASTDEAQNKGVMVVFNDEIHTAKNVTKTHTSNTSTFQSPNYGPIGSVTKTHVIFHHQPFPYKKYPNINPNIKIGIVKAHMDLSSDLLDFFVEKTIRWSNYRSAWSRQHATYCITRNSELARC